jgi:beta-N-acetylhexosaminidase
MTSTAGVGLGMVAARRALRLDSQLAPIADPVLVEIVPPSNIAVGTVPWGLSQWVGSGSVYRMSTSEGDGEGGRDADGEAAPLIGEVLAATAGGRPLLIVVRDAHRHRVTRDVVTELLAARPEAVVVEMGLPVWHPPTGSYLATFGATRASSLAAAELLGLAPDLTREVSAHGPDRP